MKILNNMEKEFIPYKLAVKLKELGFDEECLVTMHSKTKDIIPIYGVYKENPKHTDFWIKVPLWQQAFDWFRKKHKLFAKIDFFQSDEFKGVDYDYCIVNLDKPFREDGITDNIIIDYSVNETYYFKYEEARQACLEKLIELCQ